ncbi:MAG: protein translocase subunit SecD, partial [Candidatus Omnitrophota bacterium]
QRAVDIIGKTALLEFRVVSSEPEKLQAALAGSVPEGYELKYAGEEKEPLLLEKKAAMTGDSIKEASVRFNQSSFNEPLVSLEFNAEGAKKFAEITGANVGKRLAIVLDGKVQSAPVIREAIPSGQAVIQGQFDAAEAQDLSVILKVGALPAPMYIEEERSVGPLLGQDSINSGVKASIVGMALVFIFMALYYLLPGVIADLALFCNLLISLGCLGLLPYLFPGISATLTLPGIAGLVLSLGMAVDANVLINERIREELLQGRPLRAAIQTGYNKAFSAIFDSNITTLIAAFMLFQFGTGPIRGFAVTLTIGLCASLFTAVVMTRTVFELLISAGWIKSLPMMKIIKDTRMDFIGKRYIFYFISLLVIGVGMFSFLSKGARAYGIDFAGGQLQEYLFEKPVQVETVREALKEIDLADASIQQFKENPRQVLIKTGVDKNDRLTAELKKKFPGEKIELMRLEKVGPVAGKHLKDKAVKALLWSLAGILVYVGIRFRHFNFAAAGVLAIFHDVLVACGVMALSGRQMDLLTVTALLTIAGYSINDTIVIYDRVRENSHLYRNKSLYQLINLSVNQTLGRTVLTSGVTLLTVLSIFLFGGEVLGNFAFTLIVGFISGVYSTIYIASPLVLAWSGAAKKK